MANTHRGDLAFEVEGKTYTLRYSANALCELEDVTGRGFLDLSREMSSWGPPTDEKGKPLPETDEARVYRESNIRMSLLRSVFWSGLQRHHPEIDLKRAGDLMSDAGGMGPVMQLVSDAFARGFPAETKGARPTEDQTGTTG